MSPVKYLPRRRIRSLPFWPANWLSDHQNQGKPEPYDQLTLYLTISPGTNDWPLPLRPHLKSEFNSLNKTNKEYTYDISHGQVENKKEMHHTSIHAETRTQIRNSATRSPNIQGNQQSGFRSTKLRIVHSALNKR